jgi:hypothetical protein
MVISELIRRLVEIHKREGDIDVELAGGKLATKVEVVTHVAIEAPKRETYPWDRT